MSLIDMISAVFGKAKYSDGNVTVYSPEPSGTDDVSEYHWRDKNKCVACDKRRVVMQVPQYYDFGYHEVASVCAKCAKEMYGISRYLFNELVQRSEYIEIDTWAKNNYLGSEHGNV